MEGLPGRSELVYDSDADTLRTRQPVANAVRRRDDTLATSLSDEG